MISIDLKTTKGENGQKKQSITIKSNKFSDSIENASTQEALEFIVNSVNRSNLYEMKYKDFVKASVENMEVNEYKKIDLRGKNIYDFRVNLVLAQKETGHVYSTKFINSAYYVARIE